MPMIEPVSAKDSPESQPHSVPPALQRFRTALKQPDAAPLPTLEYWKAIADAGFEEAFHQALAVWSERPADLTSLDLSALCVVHPLYAKEAEASRSHPSRADLIDVVRLAVPESTAATIMLLRTEYEQYKAAARYQRLRLEARVAALEATLQAKELAQ